MYRHHHTAAESTCMHRDRQVAEALDDLEKTVTFVSPTKHGLGASVLDRTLRDDHRGEQFFKELAKLEAERKANHNAAQVTKSSSCGVHPIGEVRLGVRCWCGAVQLYAYRVPVLPRS